jgi:hypothetical protein
MKVLKGELIKDNIVIKKAAKEYKDKTDFFIALVSISYNLNVVVPFWTMREDKLFNKKKKVLFKLEDATVLKIFMDEEIA